MADDLELDVQVAAAEGWSHGEAKGVCRHRSLMSMQPPVEVLDRSRERPARNFLDRGWEATEEEFQRKLNRMKEGLEELSDAAINSVQEQSLMWSNESSS